MVIQLATGTNNLTPNVTGYTGVDATTIIWVKIDGVGSPNTFTWGYGTSGTSIQASLVPITGSAQTLGFGITVTFSAVSGGVLNDLWQFRVGSGGLL